ncbi:MAG: aminotransferase class I/II-fold pyridoxal phosphate-dependent enzyme [Rhodobacteraceae bacterium]|nr:aminotransferase class I/II-fold pyridoxal phosphate-dependent enzyme [Paracoccaceae bacterium]
MRLSHRIQNITGGGSDGWDLFNRARAMIAQGQKITELTIGEHDIGTHPDILEAMHRAATGGHTGYAAVPGTPELRRIVADRVARRTGVATGPENVLITPGGQSALFAAHHAVLDEADTGLIIDPFYATYPGTIRSLGARPHPVPTVAENGFRPTADALAAAAAETGARSLLINTPNNPTGAVYDRATLQAIAGVCAEQDLWLISDEVYDTQVWAGAHLSPRALPGMAERTLVVGSMSKSHAMTGSRCGWVVGPAEVIERLVDLSTNTTYGVPGYIQDASAFALRQGEEMERQIAAPFRRRRQIVLDALAGQGAVGALPAQGAMYTMLDIRATGMTGESFAEALLDAEAIAVMPGESFGRSAAGHLRIAMTVADEALADAMARLCRFAALQAARR